MPDAMDTTGLVEASPVAWQQESERAGPAPELSPELAAALKARGYR